MATEIEHLPGEYSATIASILSQTILNHIPMSLEKLPWGM
jgi:hypothetical protein